MFGRPNFFVVFNKVHMCAFTELTHFWICKKEYIYFFQYSYSQRVKKETINKELIDGVKVHAIFDNYGIILRKFWYIFLIFSKF